MTSEMTMEETGVTREIKNNVFCDLFSDRKNALSLYNAINGTDYEDEGLMEIVTMGDVIYLHQKNDVSVLFDSKLTLWEHQSTLNRNMPIRGLMYYARNIEGVMGKGIRRLYYSRLVKIPAPDYYVLYNGTEAMPDREDLRLSDAFLVPAEGYEFTAHMININVPHNKELMEKCPALKGYAVLVEYVRENRALGMPDAEAADQAVKRCIAEGVLADYLMKKRSEAVRMFLTEFDEEEWKLAMKEEGIEEGLEKGLEQGREEGLEKGREEGLEKGILIFIADKREDGVSDDVIRTRLKKHYGLPDEKIDSYLSAEPAAAAASLFSPVE